MGVPSPCISICAINEETDLCKGCFRHIDEVSGWLYFTDDQKREVLKKIEERKRV